MFKELFVSYVYLFELCVRARFFCAEALVEGEQLSCGRALGREMLALLSLISF